MDDRHSALLWQLMQSLTQEGQGALSEPTTFEHTLLSLKPLMPARQQLVIDLMIKLQEIKALIGELDSHH